MVGSNRIVDFRHTHMYPQSSGTGAGIRCIPEGMGSTVYGNQHRGILVNYRGTVPRQLSRVISCLPSPQDFATNQLKMDNVSAVAYINQKGGTHSMQLCNLALQIWEWCIQKGITLQAEHLPGNLNRVADTESWMVRDRCDWMINPRVFQQLQQSLDPLEIDLFASRLTKQLP